MQFHPTAIAGARLVELEPHADERGFFARSFCRREFAEQGMPTDFVQHSLSFNIAAGTLRGMHYLLPPHGEGKLIRCTRGAIHDVILDLRADSPSRLASAAFRLSPQSGLQLYIPPGCAHGFQTLEDATEVSYQMTEYHAPEAEAGFRWDDPAFALDWPLPVTRISPRDLAWAPFRG